MSWSQLLSENEYQWNVNKFVCYIMYNPRAVIWYLSIIEVLAAFIGNIVLVDIVTPQNECQQSVDTAPTECQQSIDAVSTERQQFCVLHLG